MSIQITITNSQGQKLHTSVPDQHSLWVLQDMLSPTGARAEEFCAEINGVRMNTLFRKMVASEVRSNNNKIEVIKMVRYLTKCGLVEARDIVQACVDEFQP